MCDQNITKNGRIEYIDAMRGFVIILVVMCHVSGSCLNVTSNNPSFNAIFLQFREPVFFFISGFVFYKSNHTWDTHNSLSFLRKKCSLLIIPTLVFLLIRTYFDRNFFIHNICDPYKAGYWFTIVLFEFFVLYLLLQILTNSLKINEKRKEIILFCFSLAIYVVTIPSVLEKIAIDSNILGFLGCIQWFQFLFFFLGSLAKKHFDRFQRLLQGKALITFCIAIFFGFNIFRDIIADTHYQFFRILTSTTGIVIVFAFFRFHGKLFSHQSYIGKTMCYIGKRTLDIYLMHYFLIPSNMSFTTKAFNHYPMPIIELTVSLSITLIIISVCLLISNILRLSPLAGSILFGARQR